MGATAIIPTPVMVTAVLELTLAYVESDTTMMLGVG